MRTHSFRALAFTASTIACAAAHGQCDAQWFTNVGKPGLDGPVWASARFDDGAGDALYVGGQFLGSGDMYFGVGIAKWTGKEWTAVAGFNAGPTAYVYTLTAGQITVNNSVFAGLIAGGALSAQNAPAILYTTGQGNWASQGTPGGIIYVFAVEAFDYDGPGPLHPQIIAGGSGGYMSFGPAPGFSSVQALKSEQSGPFPRMFIGGIGGTNILQYDYWTGFLPLSTGTNGPVNALCIFDDGSGPALFAGGDFTDAGGVAVNSIAKWDGESWSDVGGGVKGGLLAGVYSLAVFDDGNGEALFVGGNFDSAGGQPASNVARWDGATWSALGDGVTGDGATVLTMTPFKTGNKEFLYVGGWFDQAGGLPSNNIARWGCPQDKACYPDCDGTNSLDLFDFLCFVNQFNAGVPYSDCTQDGAYDLFDFLCFVNAFNAGCP